MSKHVENEASVEDDESTDVDLTDSKNGQQRL